MRDERSGMRGSIGWRSAVSLLIVTVLAGCARREVGPSPPPTSREWRTTHDSPGADTPGATAPAEARQDTRGSLGDVAVRKGGGYHITPPAQWLRTGHVAGVDAAFVLKKRPNDLPIVTFETFAAPAGVSFTQVVKKIGRELPQRYDHVQFLRDESVDTNVYRALFHADANQRNVTILQAISQEGKWLTIITAVDDRDRFDSHKGDFSALFKSVEQGAN